MTYVISLSPHHANMCINNELRELFPPRYVARVSITETTILVLRLHVKLAQLIWRSGTHRWPMFHYNDGIISAMTSQITSVSIVCPTVCSVADPRKHQSSASLVFLSESTVDRWIPLKKSQWCRKCFHLMTPSCVSGVQASFSAWFKKNPISIHCSVPSRLWGKAIGNSFQTKLACIKCKPRSASTLFCFIQVDLCNPSPCFNATECIDYGNEYQCMCRPGFAGKQDPNKNVFPGK